MAKGYRKSGRNLEITESVVKSVTIAELKQRRADLIAGIAHYEAALAAVDFEIEKAQELEVEEE